MKKLRLFWISFLFVFVLAFSGCQEQKETGAVEEKAEAAIEASMEEEELIPVEGEELEMLEGTSDENGDDEMVRMDQEELQEYEFEEEDGAAGIQVEEDGSYTTKEEVAVYLHSFGHLPSNFITKKEAQKLGWNNKEGNLDEVAPGKSIGGDRYKNYEGMLPEEEGRTYQECDINYDGGYRNAERIIYSNDGLIFYTGDHYETFEQLY